MAQALLKTKEVARELSKTQGFILTLIRQGKLKAIKCGKEYLINRKDLNTFLGIENNEDELKRELYIKELEGQVRAYKTQIEAIKGAFRYMENLVERG